VPQFYCFGYRWRGCGLCDDSRRVLHGRCRWNLDLGCVFYSSDFVSLAAVNLADGIQCCQDTLHHGPIPSCRLEPQPDVSSNILFGSSSSAPSASASNNAGYFSSIIELPAIALAALGGIIALL